MQEERTNTMTKNLFRKWTQLARQNLISTVFIGLGLMAISPNSLSAQNLFAPVAKVNNAVVSAYELSQRTAFLTLLRAPGDIQALALDQLIGERLQMREADAIGLALSDEKIAEGMAEFAARANMETDKFIEAIAQGGVAGETFRDFVAAGMIWREVVRAKFVSQVNITEAEIDRAIEQAEPSSEGTQVLLAEIVLPANTSASRTASNQRAAQLSEITSQSAFASAAQRYSVAPSKERGGRLEWRLLSDLPAAVASQIQSLSPGDVTDPVSVRNGVALFQLLEIRRTGGPAAQSVKLDFAQYFIPGGRNAAALAEAAKIKTRIDTCDDLYTVANGQPDDRLSRQTLPLAEVPTDIALQLAGLDKGEVSLDLTRNNGETLVFLMLCSRSRVLAESVSRENVLAQLRNQRIGMLANHLLAELRANAYIEMY